MASLRELVDQPTPPLSSLVDREPTLSSVPDATVRNNAATLALQSDNPDNVISNFQTMMSENALGDDSATEALSEAISAQQEPADFQMLMDILADPDVPIEQKGQLAADFQDNPRLRDPSIALADKALMAPSQGENLEQESVRLSVADLLDDYHQRKNERQGLINAFMIGNTDEDNQSAADFLALIAPGADAITNLKLSRALSKAIGKDRSYWDDVRDVLFPGFSALEAREEFLKLPPYEQNARVATVLDVIRQNNAIMSGDDNQIRAIQMLDRFVTGDYTTTDAVVDSLFNVLDLIGIGYGAKGVVRGFRGTKVLPEIESSSRVAPGGSVAPDGLKSPRVRANASELDKAEREYATLLSQSQSELDPGSVTALRAQLESIQAELKNTKVSKDTVRKYQNQGLTLKRAQAKANSEVQDRIKELVGRQTAIERRLAINADSERARQRIAALEVKMNNLRRDGTTTPATLNPIMDALRRIELNSIMSRDNPASVGDVLSNFNPERGRGLFKTLMESPDDQIAQAAFGTSKQDAIANQIFPQVSTDSGKVRAKVADVQREVPIDEGGIRFTDKEIDNMSALVVRDFQTARGLFALDSESSYRVVGGRQKISQMYGTSEGGFSNAADAIDQAKYALRKYGILDDEITLMKRDGLDYVPVKLSDVRGIDGDYKIRVDKDIDLDLELMDVGFEPFDVKRNFFDRMSATMMTNEGSLTRSMFDAAAMFRPEISGSFAVATDVAIALEKLLIKQADKFAKAYNSFDKARRTKVWDYVLEANEKGIKFDPNQLISDGFRPAEIDALKSFRVFWDGIFELENLDVVRTLRGQGMKLFESTAGDRFFARPIVKNRNHNRVYDPESGTARTLTDSELDDLYSTGGTVAIFKSPVDINGEHLKYMMSRETPTEYLRGINDTDKALNYREGYFQVQYKAPRFIREVNDDGSMRAVAVAGSRKEAQAEADRLTRATGKKHIETGDERAIRRDSSEYWEVNSAGGRVAQRYRGAPLEGSKGVNHIDGGEFILNPIDSAIRAARSIAGRTVTRPAIETAKARALRQYGHLLKKDEYGRPIYPDDPKTPFAVGEYTTKELADARSTFENIRRFENGYIATIDVGVKSAFNILAETMSKWSVKGERAAQIMAEGRGVTGAARGAAFTTLIALSPFRNWIMQPAQILRTISYNPTGYATGRIFKDWLNLSAYTATGKVSDDVRELADALSKTGMLDAVDRSNIVRGALLVAADNSSKLGRGVNKAVEIPRKVGFDWGEKLNLVGHYIAVWDKYRRRGSDMSDQRILAQIHSEARAISGEMNKAGDMAYTQNSFSPIFQFAQVPHKFVLGMFSRRIEPAARARMAVGDLILWGLPGTYALTEILGSDVLPDEPELRDILVSGMAAYAINWSLAKMAGDDSASDFSSLAPYELGGFADTMRRAWSDGAFAVITNSPSGQLLLKDSGKLGLAFKSLLRHFAPIDEGFENPETALDTVNQFLKLSSGWTHLTKAYIAYHTGLALDKNNIPTDDSVTTMEALMMGFGMPTKTTSKHYETIMRLGDNAKAQRETARQLANSVLQAYAGAYQGESALDPQYITRITGALLQSVEMHPQMKKMVYEEIAKIFKDPQTNLINQIMKANGMPTLELNERIIRDSPLPDEKKQQLLEMMNHMKALAERHKED